MAKGEIGTSVLCSRANVYLRLGNPEEAEACCARLRALAPGHHDALGCEGLLALAKGDAVWLAATDRSSRLRFAAGADAVALASSPEPAGRAAA